MAVLPERIPIPQEVERLEPLPVKNWLVPNSSEEEVRNLGGVGGEQKSEKTL